MAAAEVEGVILTYKELEMVESHLCIATQDYITTITINRPEKRNALTGLDRGIGHIRIAAVDSEEQAVALLNPKSTQTSTVASDRKTVLLLLSHQCA